MVSRSRTARWWVAAAFIAVAVAVCVALVRANQAVTHTDADGTPAGAAPGPFPTPTTTVNPADAPTPPAHGAYFGAYPQPASDTQPARIAAVDTLQQQLGRQLGIVHVYLKWQAPFPTSSDLAILHQNSILLLSWAGADTRTITSGAYDSLIRQRAREIKATGKPIFLEWRWEMTRPNLSYQIHSPADYVAAWDHIRSIFAQEHVKNVAWVWCPSSWAFANGSAQAYYPGNNEVDWVCADAYPPSGYHSFADVVHPLLDWASHHSKPVMIGEYGVPRSYLPQQRAQWLRAAGQTARSDPQVKALVYFDGDPAGNGVRVMYGLDPGSAPLQALRAVADERYFAARDHRPARRQH